MKKLHIKLGVGAVALVLAVGYLAYAGMKQAQLYYLEVDDYLAQPEMHAQRVKLNGTVAEGSIVESDDGLEVTFQLAGDTGQVPVRFRGVRSDMFGPGGNVVVEGRMTDAGTFEANNLMTKCASKYEAKPEGHPDASVGEEAVE